jgi:hypothetical protein
VSELTQYHIQRFGALKSDRGNWNTQWEEAAARILPAHRDSFFAAGMTTGLGQSGQKKTEQQYDSTAGFAAQRFSSVIESLATPQSAIWHRLVPVDKSLKRNRAVRMFFDELSDLLFSYRYRPVGNFVGNSQQVYLGLGVYGNGVLYVDRPDNERGLRYRNIHLGEAYFAENHAGVVDTLYRNFYLTAKQVVQQFGMNAPEAIRTAAGQPGQSNNKFEILHCVYPREDYDPMRVDSKGKKFASLYIAVAQQHPMREGGFDVFPFAIARYTQASGEVYGRGPAQHVLPAIKVLNEEKRTVLKQGHRIVDPVLLAHDDGNLGSFSMKAGALNAGGVSKEGRLLVQPLPTGNIAVGDKLMQMEKDIINDAFLNTLFQILIDTPQMTATEVLERAREKGMLLAPTAGRLQAEFLGPLIERELDLMAQQGIWPANMPAILRDAGAAEYKIEYDSPMSRMQRSEKAGGFMRALSQAAEYAKMTGDMEPLDWFNFDTATPEIMDIQGSPAAWSRSAEEVEMRRASRAEAAQQQQMVDAAPALASMAKNMPQGQTT